MTKNQIAEILDKAAQNVEAVEQLAALNQINLSDAYEIQRFSIDRRIERGEKITGFKLGFTSYAKMEQMGVHDLIWGILTDKMLLNPDEEVDLNRWIHPRAEPEIAFRVSKDIDKALTLDEIPKYIDKMAAAIEVIDSRYKNFKFSLEDVIADNCSSTGYVLGEWHDLRTDISDLKINLIMDDEVVEMGKTSAILENPLQSIVELSRLATEDKVPVKKGHIILAGAATAAVYLNKGNHVSSELETMGRVGFEVKK